jgi:hypothetical protein
MQLEPTKSKFTHDGWSYTVTCFHVTDDACATYRFVVDRCQDQQNGIVSDSLLLFADEEAPSMNAMVVVQPLLNRVAERVGELIRAGQVVPPVLDSTFWR